jgi:hypothetical protein
MTGFARSPAGRGRAPRIRGVAPALVLAALLVPAAAFAQSVEATVDRDRIGAGETVTLSIVLEGNFDDTTGPEMPDFEVVGRSTGSSVSIVNGKVSRQQQVVLRLAPRRAGALTIGPIAMRVDGRVVAASKAITVRVGDAAPDPEPEPAPGGTMAPPAAPPEPEPEPVAPGQAVPERLANERAFVIARTPDRPLYVGEPFYVEYVLYTRSDLPLTGLGMETAPKLQAFVVQQGPADAEQVARARVRGRTFDTRVVWRGALSALAPGRSVVDAIRLRLVVGDFFGRQQVTIASDPVALEFRTPPTEGRPADFVEGTLGSFVLKATTDRTVLRVGESALLTVEITGSGNLRAIQPPKIPVPEGLRVAQLPSTDLDEVVFDVGGVSGRRVFQYLLTPEREGAMTVGRIELPFFNSISERYERARTEPFEIVATGRDAGPVRQAGPSGREPVTAIATATPDLDAPAAPPAAPDRRGWAFAGMTLPVAFFVGAELAVRRRRRLAERADEIARRRALAHARRTLEAIARRERRQPSPDFWDALDRAIRAFVEARFQVPTTGMTRDELRAALAGRQAPADAVEAVLDELEACAFARFAPSAAQDRDRDAALARVRDCLAALDRAPDGRAGR